MKNGIAKKCLGWLAACGMVLGTMATAWADTEMVDGVEGRTRWRTARRP